MRGVTLKTFVQMSQVLISTHTPHARRDMKFMKNGAIPSIFQLTRLMRGVTP